jgi:hypothetical protein
MISGALTPTIPFPLEVVTTKPRLAARLYAGAVRRDADDDAAHQPDRAGPQALALALV